ncbi:MAG: hypothetical protein KC668_23015 [Myxococcales bacterium]|nr:hypothetical protein [Myxococcales bacterium]
MPRARDLALFQLLCTSGMDVMAQMPLLSEVLHRLVPSFSLSMIRVDERCVPSAHYSEFFDEASHALFAASGDHFATRSPDPAAFANLMSNRDPVGALIDARPEYLGGLIYQHLFQPNGIHHTLDVALRERGEPLAILGIFRERSAPPFRREDVRLVRSLYDQLVHACRAEPAAGPFDEVDSAMMVVSPAGRIVWASTTAREWLAEVSGGAERASMLDRGLVPDACRAILAMVRRARMAPRAGEVAAAPHVSVPLPGGRLDLRGYALESDVAGAEGHVGIQLRVEVARDLRLLRALDATRLTPQQLRIAWGLCRGMSNSELGMELALSAATLKSYQKDMYRRMEVGSARALVERLETLSASARVDRTRHLPVMRSRAAPSRR